MWLKTGVKSCSDCFEQTTAQEEKPQPDCSKCTLEKQSTRTCWTNTKLRALFKTEQVCRKWNKSKFASPSALSPTPPLLLSLYLQHTQYICVIFKIPNRQLVRLRFQTASSGWQDSWVKIPSSLCAFKCAFFLFVTQACVVYFKLSLHPELF